VTPRGPAWERFVAEWGRHAHAIAVPEACAAGVADERARGMRRAARYAEAWHVACALEEYETSQRTNADEDPDALYRALRSRARQDRAALRCDSIARGEPAFTTARAFRGGEE